MLQHDIVSCQILLLLSFQVQLDGEVLSKCDDLTLKFFYGYGVNKTPLDELADGTLGGPLETQANCMCFHMAM